MGRPNRGPNALLVVDSVRAADRRLYGAPHEPTPSPDRFADEATT